MEKVEVVLSIVVETHAHVLKEQIKTETNLLFMDICIHHLVNKTSI